MNLILKPMLKTMTMKLMKQFFSVIHDGKDPHGWLTFINDKKTAKSPAAKKPVKKK
ncbi:MAG: hypothetical protein JNL32_11170 [Candidatus Kapabacteria bacterium]|nr:hypothetical protein [Candidatus Kapabacteria bacterium]